MTFRSYLDWLKALPPLLRWFPLLVVIRPIADNFYFLKNVSPFLSPPYIIGVLTPILCIAAMLSYKSPKFGVIDRAAVWWSATLLLACLGLYIFSPSSLMMVEFILKLSLPVYIYFFLRIFITDLRDFQGIMQSFIYAAIMVAVIMLYELLVNPIGTQESRGLERIQGGFGDVVSYGMYVVFSLIIATYFYMLRQAGKIENYGLGSLIAVIVLGLLALLNIHHTATYSVFVLVIGLFIIYQFSSNAPTTGIVLLIIAGIGMSYFGSFLIEERISPLVQTDIEVLSGEKDSDRLLHGRVGRWRNMLDLLYTQSPWVQFFGYPLQRNFPYSLIGIGSHNDFIRMLFATGFFGLFCYLRFLFIASYQLARKPSTERYLLQGIFLGLFLYSISVTPTFYPPFMYFALAGIAYLALPQKEVS